VIWVEGIKDVPDLYVWLGDGIAPDADIDFIAHSREDVPRLISLLTERRSAGT
jgi:hypothetical protein